MIYYGNRWIHQKALCKFQTDNTPPIWSKPSPRCPFTRWIKNRFDCLEFILCCVTSSLAVLYLAKILEVTHFFFIRFYVLERDRGRFCFSLAVIDLFFELRSWVRGIARAAVFSCLYTPSTKMIAIGTQWRMESILINHPLTNSGQVVVLVHVGDNIFVLIPLFRHDDLVALVNVEQNRAEVMALLASFGNGEFWCTKLADSPLGSMVRRETKQNMCFLSPSIHDWGRRSDVIMRIDKARKNATTPHPVLPVRGWDKTCHYRSAACMMQQHNETWLYRENGISAR